MQKLTGHDPVCVCVCFVCCFVLCTADGCYYDVYLVDTCPRRVSAALAATRCAQYSLCIYDDDDHKLGWCALY